MRIQSGNDIENGEKNQAIRNRESWLKVLVIALFSVIIAWKLITTPININMADFRFTDLLSLLLAIFATVLSVAFYFKATDTSNIFYDNTYKFTRDVSEILGRIEVGFGERLKHLDEGYFDLIDRLPIDIPKVEKEVEKEKEEVKKTEEERNQLLEELMEKASLEQKEKKELFEILKKKDEALRRSMEDLAFLQRELKNEKNRVEELTSPSIPNRFLLSTGKFLIQLAERLDVLNASPEVIRERFNRVKGDIPDKIINDMKQNGYIDSRGNLTSNGVKRLLRRAREMQTFVP